MTKAAMPLAFVAPPVWLPILTLEDWRKKHPEGYPQIPVLFKPSPELMKRSSVGL